MAMGLPGRRVEAIRAGIRIIGVISTFGGFKGGDDAARPAVDAGVAIPYDVIKFLGSTHGKS
jgi:hypothetical protein